LALTDDPAVAWTVACVLATVFGAAGATKLRALEVFAGVVANYRLLPEAAVRPVAYALPVVEVVAAVCLLVPAPRPLAAAVVVLLLLAFAAAMAVNLRRGRDHIDCGCFVSLLRQRIGWPLVARNLLLAAACGLPLVVADGGTAGRALTGLDGFTVVGATASLLLLYAAIGRLFGLAPVTLGRAG
jgi:uncharacterized membrane protein